MGNCNLNLNANKATSITLKCRLVTISKCTYCICGETVLYKLYSIRSDDLTHMGYAIGVKGFGSRALCFVGHDRNYATDLYDKISKSAVTPCTLHDVIEDWKEAKINDLTS